MADTKVSKLQIRRPYDASTGGSIIFNEPTLTKQSFQDECDINTIMDKYESTGVLQHVSNVQQAYGDFSNVQEYQLSLNQVIAAQEAFDELPSRVRERFGNDPAHLMAFLEDKENRAEAVKLGLIDPDPEAPAPTRVEIVNPPQPKAPKGASGASQGDATDKDGA